MGGCSSLDNGTDGAPRPVTVDAEQTIGAGDIDGASGRSGVMFPNWDADATVEASYNFGPTDAVIQNMRATGAEIFFRVGRSAEGMALMSGSYSNNYVPKNADK